jgi:hypothetical protein
VIRASVVGKAMPAARPPTRRATTSTSIEPAQADATAAGTDSTSPAHMTARRPYRSPSAPSHSTDAARPSEYPTATRLSAVCEQSKCAPMLGSATNATDNGRFAIAATRIRVARTMPARAGATPRSGTTVALPMATTAG